MILLGIVTATAYRVRSIGWLMRILKGGGRGSALVSPTCCIFQMSLTSLEANTRKLHQLPGPGQEIGGVQPKDRLGEEPVLSDGLWPPTVGLCTELVIQLSRSLHGCHQLECHQLRGGPTPLLLSLWDRSNAWGWKFCSTYIMLVNVKKYSSLQQGWQHKQLTSLGRRGQSSRYLINNAVLCA